MVSPDFKSDGVQCCVSNCMLYSSETWSVKRKIGFWSSPVVADEDPQGDCYCCMVSRCVKNTFVAWLYIVG